MTGGCSHLSNLMLLLYMIRLRSTGHNEFGRFICTLFDDETLRFTKYPRFYPRVIKCVNKQFAYCLNKKRVLLRHLYSHE